MSTKKPMVLVIAGPNGSGKSTFTQYFEKIGEYTNADDIVAATGMNNADAARLVDAKRYKKSLGNIKKLLEICDILHVYDNTLEPFRIIRKHKDYISIYANDLWSKEEILALM